jgi:hypothetical protein
VRVRRGGCGRHRPHVLGRTQDRVALTDLSALLYEELQSERRPNDHLLHASAHLEGSLRHAQLDVAGAPKIHESFVRGVPLWIGSLIHEDIHRMLRKRGVPYLAEVDVTPYLPEGWAGTLDALIWQPEAKAFALADFKTTKGAALRYIEERGAKSAHVLQTSAYYWAAKKMGLPLTKEIGVLYVPKDEARDVEGPLLVEFEPTPQKELHAEMKERLRRVNEYTASLDHYTSGRYSEYIGVVEDPRRIMDRLEGWITDALEPVQEREQVVKYDPKTETWDVLLKPHWSTAYCSFPDELCNCRTQGVTKIGTYDVDGVTYYARTGYEDIAPVVSPA